MRPATRASKTADLTVARICEKSGAQQVTIAHSAGDMVPASDNADHRPTAPEGSEPTSSLCLWSEPRSPIFAYNPHDPTQPEAPIPSPEASRDYMPDPGCQKNGRSNAFVNTAAHASQRTAPLQRHDKGNSIKSYTLDQEKAVKKKLDACDRSAVVILQHDRQNYTVTFSTAAFEMARNVLCTEILRMPKKGKQGLNQHVSSKSITYHPTKDKTGITVSECIQIKSWAAVSKDAMSKAEVDIQQGKCSIALNMYKTSTKCLINGKQATEFMDIFETYLANIDKMHGQEIQMQDRTYKDALQDYLAKLSNSNTNTIRSGKNQGRPKTENNHVTPEHGTGSDTESEVEEKPKCVHCNRFVHTRAVACDTCTLWRHYRCEGMSEEEIQKVEDPGIPYECKGCKVIVDDIHQSGLNPHDSPGTAVLQALEPNTGNLTRGSQIPPSTSPKADNTNRENSNKPAYSIESMDARQATQNGSSTVPDLPAQMQLPLRQVLCPPEYPHMTVQAPQPQPRIEFPPSPDRGNSPSCQATGIYDHLATSIAGPRRTLDELQEYKEHGTGMTYNHNGVQGNQKPVAGPTLEKPGKKAHDPKSIKAGRKNAYASEHHPSLAPDDLQPGINNSTCISPGKSELMGKAHTISKLNAQNSCPCSARALVLDEREKQLQAKEKALRTKQSLIEKKQFEYNEASEQVKELAKLVSGLEGKINTLSEENRLLKLKLLITEDVSTEVKGSTPNDKNAASEAYAPANMQPNLQATHSTCSCTQVASPHAASHLSTVPVADMESASFSKLTNAITLNVLANLAGATTPMGTSPNWSGPRYGQNMYRYGQNTQRPHMYHRQNYAKPQYGKYPRTETQGNSFPSANREKYNLSVEETPLVMETQDETGASETDVHHTSVEQADLSHLLHNILNQTVDDFHYATDESMPGSNGQETPATQSCGSNDNMPNTDRDGTRRKTCISEQQKQEGDPRKASPTGRKRSGEIPDCVPERKLLRTLNNLRLSPQWMDRKEQQKKACRQTEQTGRQDAPVSPSSPFLGQGPLTHRPP